MISSKECETLKTSQEKLLFQLDQLQNENLAVKQRCSELEAKVKKYEEPRALNHDARENNREKDVPQSVSPRDGFREMDSPAQNPTLQHDETAKTSSAKSAKTFKKQLSGSIKRTSKELNVTTSEEETGPRPFSIEIQSSSTLNNLVSGNATTLDKLLKDDGGKPEDNSSDKLAEFAFRPASKPQYKKFKPNPSSITLSRPSKELFSISEEKNKSLILNLLQTEDDEESKVRPSILSAVSSSISKLQTQRSSTTLLLPDDPEENEGEFAENKKETQQEGNNDKGKEMEIEKSAAAGEALNNGQHITESIDQKPKAVSSKPPTEAKRYRILKSVSLLTQENTQQVFTKETVKPNFKLNSKKPAISADLFTIAKPSPRHLLGISKEDSGSNVEASESEMRGKKHVQQKDFKGFKKNKEQSAQDPIKENKAPNVTRAQGLTRQERSALTGFECGQCKKVSHCVFAKLIGISFRYTSSMMRSARITNLIRKRFATTVLGIGTLLRSSRLRK